MTVVNIVGGGLAGSFVAKELDNRGVPHRVFDCDDPHGASRWSENLYVETWLKGNPHIRSSLEWLYDNYPARLIQLWTGKTNTPAHHIPVNETMHSKPIRKLVTEVLEDGLLCGSDFYAGKTVICAGARCNQLMDPLWKGCPTVSSIAGHVLLFEGTTANRALGAWMRAYRPYKHEKVMPWWDGRVRYADSLTVTVNRFRKGMWDYHSDALARAESIGLSGGHEYAWGYRPRVKGCDDLGLRVFGSSNVQMVTGGYTNGMILYPELARRVAESLDA